MNDIFKRCIKWAIMAFLCAPIVLFAQSNRDSHAQRRALELIAFQIVKFTNAAQFDSLAGLYSPDVLIYVNGDKVLTGREALRQVFTANQKTFPQSQITADHIFYDQSSIIIEERTNSVSASGKTVRQAQVRVEVVQNGLIIQERFYLDNASFARQMGN